MSGDFQDCAIDHDKRALIGTCVQDQLSHQRFNEAVNVHFLRNGFRNADPRLHVQLHLDSRPGLLLNGINREKRMLPLHLLGFGMSAPQAITVTSNSQVKVCP